MKNGGKNKSVAFIILFSIIRMGIEHWPSLFTKKTKQNCSLKINNNNNKKCCSLVK